MLCCAVLDEGSSRFAGSGSTSDIKIVWLASHHHTYPSGKNGTHPIIPLPSFLCEFRKTRAEIYLIDLFLLRPFRRNFAPLCPLLSERSTLFCPLRVVTLVRRSRDGVCFCSSCLGLLWGSKSYFSAFRYRRSG